jgi:hypothetical protein
MIVKNKTWAKKKAAEVRDRYLHLADILSRLSHHQGQPNPYRVWALRQLARTRQRLAYYEAQL